MYEFFVEAHSYLRWLVLGAALLACFGYLRGYFGKNAFGRLDDRLGLFYVGILHLQLLLGLLLYFVFSPIKVSDLPEGWIKIAALRTRVLEHPLLMLLAIAAGQIGRSLSKRAASDKSKFARGALLYPLSLLLLLLGIPWRG